jgi:hypothetical protein
LSGVAHAARVRRAGVAISATSAAS